MVHVQGRAPEKRQVERWSMSHWGTEAGSSTTPRPGQRSLDSLKNKGETPVEDMQLAGMFCAVARYPEFLRQYFTGGSNSHANFIYVKSK